MPVGNKERHRSGRIGWLRAAVLGANDGILSTSSLVLGVAAAHATHRSVLVAGMADLALERAERKADDKGEHKELWQSMLLEGSLLRSRNRSPSS
jgi:vacuolar iron transporter family protein